MPTADRHPGSLTPDELDQMAREMDRVVVMAEVRASIARISRAAAQPGVFVLPVVRDASAHRRQLDAIAADRAGEARTTREESP